MKAPKVFISYSHVDEKWKDCVVKHLGVLVQDARLELWDDRRIAAGDNWLPEIQNAIRSCDVALLLISADFLTSNFILNREVPPLLQRRASEGIRLVPVILRPCAWKQVAWFTKLQARPKDGKPLSAFSDHGAEETLTALVEELWILPVSDPISSAKVASDLAPKSKAAKRPEKAVETLVDCKDQEGMRIRRNVEPSELFLQVTSGDPLLAPEAARALINHPELLPTIVDQCARSPVTERAILSIVRAHAEASASLLMERLKTRDWHLGLRSSPYFDLAHARYCEKELSDLITRGSFDSQKLALEAFGRCASTVWAHHVAEVVADENDYECQKLGSFAVQALARLMVRSPRECGGSLANVSTEMLRLLSTPNAVKYRWHYDAKYVLRACDGSHADVLITKWLTSPHPSVVTTAADILGSRRIQRATSHLIELMHTRSEPAVRRSCAFALGSIGSAAATTALLRGCPGTDAVVGLAHALDRIEDPLAFKEAVDRVKASSIDERFLLWRAIGLRHDSKLLVEVQNAVEATDPVDRAVAILALARIKEISPSHLRMHFHQSANSYERIQAALAIIVSDARTFPELADQLRQDLAEKSYMLLPHQCWDILDVLYRCGNQQATELADAWRSFYELNAEIVTSEEAWSRAAQGRST